MRTLATALVLAFLLVACSTDGGTTAANDATSELDGGHDLLPLDTLDVSSDLNRPSDADADDSSSDTDTPCAPNCDGLECGDDGCGGVCGTCDEGKICQSGICQDLPPACGDGTCDDTENCETCALDCTCPATSVCHEGACCQPTCQDWECGTEDTCGTSCGDCDPGFACDVDHTCVPEMNCTEVWQCLGTCEDGLDCLDTCTTTASEDARAWLEAVLQCFTETCGDLTDQECIDGAIQYECLDIVDDCCIPDCSNKECGDGGCGVSCGTCPDGPYECQEGHCNCLNIFCGGECCLDADATCFNETCCVPQCDGKECGDDTCGGACGVCPGQFDQCIGGTCQCIPQCDGLECGPDGCGGECGACSTDGPWACDNGTCICSNELCVDVCCSNAADVCFEGSCCKPVCDGKNCGDDQCGGTCGTCPWNLPDCLDGHCVCIPQCDGKDCGSDECGNECGICDAGSSCIDFLCIPDLPGEFVANQELDGNQTTTRLLQLSDGNLLVAWLSRDPSTLVFSLVGRVFTPTGVAVTDDFSISGDIAVANNVDLKLVQVDGGFLAAWHSSRIHIAKLDNAGNTLIAPVTLVDSNDTYRTVLPFFSDGVLHFVYSKDEPTLEEFYLGTLTATLEWAEGSPTLMPWTENIPAKSVLAIGSTFYIGFWDGTVSSFDMTGTKVSGPVAVTTTMPDSEYERPYPILSLLADGNILASYDLLTDDLGYEVRTTTFSPTLAIVHQDVVLNVVSEGFQWKARSVPLPDGGYMATWYSDNLDGNFSGVAMRRVLPDGTVVGDREMTVPEYTSGTQGPPDVAFLAANQTVAAAWYSLAHPDGGTPYDISARIIPLALFQ